MIRRPPRSTLSSSSAASDVYKRQVVYYLAEHEEQVAGTFKQVIGDKTGWETKKGQAVKTSGQVPEGMEVISEMLQKGVSRVILTSVGDGPKKTEEHLC